GVDFESVNTSGSQTNVDFTVNIKVCGDTNIEPTETFTFQVADNSGFLGTGSNRVFTATGTIVNDEVNQPPVNAAPHYQPTSEDTTKVFSSGNSNAISISDPDAGGAALRVTLTGTNGTVSLSGIAGLSFSVGDGTADPTMTFTGTITAINTALNGLSF